MIINKLIEKGIQLGLEEVEVYANQDTRKTIKVEDGKLNTLNTNDISGYSIRGKLNGKMGYYYAENIKESDIDEIIGKIILNAKLITSEEEEIMFDGNAEYQHIEEVKTNGNDYSNLDKINMLLELEKQIKAVDPRIVKVCYDQYVESDSTTQIVNSKGLNLKREVSYLLAVTGALAFENGQSTVGYAQSIASDYTKIEKERLVKECTDNALVALGAGSVQTGQYPIVFNRDCMTELVGAFSSIFSSEVALKKMTKLEGKEGTKIFGNNITLIDDPFHENAILKMAFDDEGYPCSTTKVVENGVFNTMLYNLKTAKIFGKTSTGNGFKPGAASSVKVSPTNFYLQPGKHSETELITSIDNGIYITEINGLHAGLDIISGDFNVQSSGRLIKNGKLDQAVTLFVISGNYYDMMNNIEEVANNLEKNFVGTAAPSVKVRSLAVSGK